MRFSRTCYDKAHRCPGWAGGGTRSPRKENHPCNGYVTSRRPWDGQDDTYPGHPAEGLNKWLWGRCNKCDVVTWPVITRWLDPGWWKWQVPFNIRQRLGW